MATTTTVIDASVSVDPYILPQAAAARYLGRSYYWLWERRKKHPLYKPENENSGNGKTAWFLVKRLRLIADVEMEELDMDEAYKILLDYKTAHRSDNAQALVLIAQKENQKNRRRGAKRAKAEGVVA